MRTNVRSLIVWSWMLLTIASAGAAGPDRRLVEAARNKDRDAVRTLLRQGVDVNSRLGDGTTALHWAAHWGEVETVDLLIRSRADVNAKDDLGMTPLVLACTGGNAALVEKLLSAGANPNTALPTGETPLMTAARTGRVEVVRALLVRGAGANAKESTMNQTALMWAAAEGHSSVVRALVETGVDVNARSATGYSALLFAAKNGELEATRILLDGGADINAPSSDGMTPLVMAAIRGFTSYAEFLMDRGADVNNAAAGYTVLHWAAGAWDTELTTNSIKTESSEWSSSGGLREPLKLEFVKKLVARGADVNARMTKNPGRVGGGGNGGVGAGGTNLAGATPFYLAADSADADLMRFLVGAGADPTVTTRSNRTPLMAAAGIGRTVGNTLSTDAQALEATKLALELGSEVNAADFAGDTALHAAAYWGTNALVQFLVSSGASVDPKNKAGNTPFMIANGQGPRVGGANPHNPETAALLGKLGANTNTTCEWPCIRK